MSICYRQRVFSPICRGVATHTHPYTDIEGGDAVAGDILVWNGEFWLPSSTAGSAVFFASIPALIASTDPTLKRAICFGAYTEYDGNLSIYERLGTGIDDAISLTPRIPNGQSILATAAGVWMWRTHFEEAPEQEEVIIPPGGMPYTTSYPQDFDTIPDAKESASGTKSNRIMSDLSGNYAEFWRVADQPGGTEDVAWYVNASGYFYRRVASAGSSTGSSGDIFETMADAQASDLNTLFLTVLEDGNVEFSTYRRDPNQGAPDTSGTEGVSWFVNSIGVYYRQIA